MRIAVAVEIGEKRDVLTRREIRIDGDLLRRVTDGTSIGARGFAEDGDRAAVGTRETDDRFDRRRFPRAIAADQAIERTGFDLETDIFENPFAPERALEMVDDQRRDHARSAAAMLR